MTSDGSSERQPLARSAVDMTARPTVFVVDDNPGVRASLQALWHAAGLKVASYLSAGEFLGAYERGTPGLPDPERPARPRQRR